MTSAKIFTEDDMFLTDDSPLLPGSLPKIDFNSLEWTERRLLITEIAFLTKVWNETEIPSPTCIYINSSSDSGKHIKILSDLFPAFHFFCYSVHSLDLEPVEKRISLFTGHANGIFTYDMAADFNGSNDNILISNLESQSSVNMLMEEYERFSLKFENGLDKESILSQNEGEDVITRWSSAMASFRAKERVVLAGDAMRQYDWMKIIRPQYALLKFRPPIPITIPDVKTHKDPMSIISYIDGDYYWPAWGSADLGEIHIGVSNLPSGYSYSEKIWNLRQFTLQRRYQNYIVRRQIQYINNCSDGSELLNDYDSTYECHILATFLLKFSPAIESELIEKTRLLSQYITQNLGGSSLAERRESKNKKYILIPEKFELSPVYHTIDEIPGNEPENWYDPRI